MSFLTFGCLPKVEVVIIEVFFFAALLAYALLYYLCYQFAPSLGTLASGTSGLSAVVSITAGRSF